MSIDLSGTDKPSKPEGPLEIMDVYRDRCRLSWKPPKDDGGRPILRYVVEAQDMDSQKWVKVGKVMGDTQCGVPGLQPGKQYKFRVKAVNSEGESEPLVADSEILAKDPYGELVCLPVLYQFFPFFFFINGSLSSVFFLPGKLHTVQLLRS